MVSPSAEVEIVVENDGAGKSHAVQIRLWLSFIDIAIVGELDRQKRGCKEFAEQDGGGAGLGPESGGCLLPGELTRRIRLAPY